MIFSKVAKDSLLKNAPSPRIVMIGGSNLAFGINSQMIKDSLGLNPVNTGIHAAIGLMYMLDNAESHIRKGDVVVVSPEYEQFFGELAYGSEQLLRVAYDASPRAAIFDLKKKQLLTIMRSVPRYAMAKLNPFEYFRFQHLPNYSVESFNQYGDVYTHWNTPGVKVPTLGPVKDELNEEVFDRLVAFKDSLANRGALLFVAYPAFQQSSFDAYGDKIGLVETKLKATGIPLLGTPARYTVPDSMLFDTQYHLSKQGLDHRTHLLIEDLRKALTKENLAARD
ncbi:MAG: hypothetical protein EOO01_23965 [Chitinophagaceae bacterium]|nr:MAG: hypothetical protein EOO01_23965 [Chitinophagaceae bacterium]